jgi:hypothetical protein
MLTTVKILVPDNNHDVPEGGMMDHAANIDERWVTEWIAFGLSEMETYLKKHARFEAYCDRRTTVRRGHTHG